MAVGKAVLRSEFLPAGNAPFGSKVMIEVDDKLVGQGQLNRTVFRHGLKPFEIARDSIKTIRPAFKDKGAFPSTGPINKVTIELKK